MMEVGRVCLKIAGRDAGRTCVIVEMLDNGYVTIDGQTRRRKCNVKHLEPLDKVLDVGSGDESSVKSAFDSIGLAVRETNPKKAADRPRQQRVQKTKPVKKKAAKKETKKAEKAEVAKKEDKAEKKVSEAKVEEKPAEK